MKKQGASLPWSYRLLVIFSFYCQLSSSFRLCWRGWCPPQTTTTAKPIIQQAKATQELKNHLVSYPQVSSTLKTSGIVSIEMAADKNYTSPTVSPLNNNTNEHYKPTNSIYPSDLIEEKSDNYSTIIAITVTSLSCCVIFIIFIVGATLWCRGYFRKERRIRSNNQETVDYEDLVNSTNSSVAQDVPNVIYDNVPSSPVSQPLEKADSVTYASVEFLSGPAVVDERAATLRRLRILDNHTDYAVIEMKEYEYDSQA